MAARRTVLRWTLALAAALLLVPALAVAVIAWVGVRIDAAPWRTTLAAVATEALGRRVALEGPVELSLGLRSALQIGGIRIANPAGFSGPEFATLGDVRAEVDLTPALQGRLRIHSLEAENVRVRLERSPDGRANWVFDALRDVADANAALPPPAADAAAPPTVAVRIRRLALRNLSVEYLDGAAQRSRYFDLDELAGEAPWNGPLKLAVRGRIEKSFPYRLSLEGGPARALYRATEPWPFTIDFEFVDTRLHATGSTDPRDGETRLQLGLGTANLAELERLLEIKLPKLGMTAFAAVVAHRGEAVDVEIVRGVVGDSELTGRLRFETAGRPRVAGELAIATFDLRPFLEIDPAAAQRPLTFAALERQPLSARALGALDADVTLAVGRWLGLPAEVRDARLALRIADGKLQAPLRARVAGVPLAGRLELGESAGAPALSLQLSARDSPLGDLAEVLTGLSGVEGTLGRFDLRLAGRGDTLGALVRDLDARMTAAAAKLTYGNVPGGRPVELALDAFDVAIPRGGALAGSARGALLGEPIAARIRGGDLVTTLREARTPIEILLQGAGGNARLAGAIARPGAPGGTELDFRLEGRRAGDLAAWLGTSPRASARVALQGRYRAGGDEWHLEDFKLALGASELAIDAHASGSGASSLVIAAVRSALIDVPELASLFPERAADPKGARTEIDVPILPRGIDLADADLGLGIARIALGRGDVVNLGLAARVRGGRMAASPFGATFAGTPFGGTVALDLRGETPEAALTMAAGNVDVGRLLRALGIAEDLEASVGQLEVELTGRGSRLAEMLERSSFAARLQGGRLRLRGPQRREIADIRLAEAAAAAEPGRPVAVRLDGSLDDVPIAIRIASGALADFARDAKHLPFSLTAESAGARLALDGRVTLPVREATADLKLLVSGDRLDSLARLTGARLPPWGPWSIAGPLRITATAYEVPDLAATVGASRLTGEGRLELGGAKPRLDLRVKAPRLQLDDFELAGWSAFDAPPTAGASAADLEALRAKVKDAAAQTEALASARVLRRLDGYLDVEVSEVRSGADRLGSGWLRLQLENGRLFLGPAEVNTPGGTARFSGAYEPTERDVHVALGAYVERFDYGILARRVRPDAGAEGLFSLELELAGRAPSLSALMAHASGRIDFAVWPRNLKSGVFDLWAVNVFLALLPEVDPSAESRVNCAFARLDLRDGKLKEDALLIDTSRIRVSGRGGVDFAGDTLAFRFEPRAKTPQPFSLATPVEVTGTLTDFHVGPSPGDLLATVPRFLGSLILAPIEALGVELVPRDGRDVCADPLRAPRGARR